MVSKCVLIYIYIHVYIYMCVCECVCVCVYVCVCVCVSVNKKNTQNLFKLQIFLFLSEALSMYKKITNENTDNSAT